jgi:hypothetical protein
MSILVALQQLANNLDGKIVEDKVDEILQTTEEDTDLYRMAKFVKENLYAGAEESKKELVDYSYVSDPSDYVPKGDE